MGVGLRFANPTYVCIVGRISRRRNPTHPALKSDTPTIPSTGGFLHHFHEGGFGAGEAAAAGYFFAAEAHLEKLCCLGIRLEFFVVGVINPGLLSLVL